MKMTRRHRQGHGGRQMKPRLWPLKPRRVRNRFGDLRRIWRRLDGAAQVVESTGIDGIAMPRHYHVVKLLANGQLLVSTHRKRSAALRAGERVR